MREPRHVSPVWRKQAGVYPSCRHAGPDGGQIGLAIARLLRIKICDFAKLAGCGAAGFIHPRSGCACPPEFGTFEDIDAWSCASTVSSGRRRNGEYRRAERISCLLSFARDIPANGQLLIHYHAGFSRSPASAMLVLAKYSLDFLRARSRANCFVSGPTYGLICA